MLKNAIATTAVVAIAAIPPHSSQWLGPAGYLGTIVTVFGHPGRRFGQMAEALVLIIAGMMVGVGWGVLGLWLSSLLHDEGEGKGEATGFAVRGVFFAVAAMLHGYFRSKTPRLFLGVLVMVFIVTVMLTTTAREVTPPLVTQILWPILIAVAVLVVVNVGVFPEFSSGFLGRQVCESVEECVRALEMAGEYFVHRESGIEQKGSEGRENTSDESGRARGISDGARKRLRTLSTRSKRSKLRVQDEGGVATVTIQDVVTNKSKLRERFKACKAAQQECNFELFVGVLPPFHLKPISSRIMKRLVASTISVIGACESKFALIGDGPAFKSNEEHGKTEREPKDTHSPTNGLFTRPFLLDTFHLGMKSEEHQTEEKAKKSQLDATRPKREIEFGDARLLRYLISSITAPYRDFFSALDGSIVILHQCIGHVYVGADHRIFPSLTSAGRFQSPF